jgi:hypothetical protein
MGYSSRTMHRVIGPELSRIGSRSILESSDKWCGHHVRPTWTQSSIYGTWWRGPFAPKILRLQIPGSCGRLSKRHGSTFLQRSSVHLWNRCHVELLHFAGLEGVLHDTRYLSHDFWHFSVYKLRQRNRYSDWLRAGWTRGRSLSSGRVKNYIFSTSSRPTLESIEPLIQWVPGALSPGG